MGEELKCGKFGGEGRMKKGKLALNVNTDGQETRRTGTGESFAALVKLMCWGLGSVANE